MSDSSSAPSLKANFTYSLLYQLLILVLPLITLPYVSRIFGSENIGKYTYVHAFADYFVLGSMLGINTHGKRTIAAVRNNKEELSRTFCELFVLQLIPSLFFSSIYILYCLLFVRSNRIIYLLHSLYVISSIFNINWFCSGMENFRLITIRNTIVHVASTISVFLFVRTNSDLWIYTLILCSATFFSYISIWPYTLKTIHRTGIDIQGTLRHLRPILVLFIPVIANSIYHLMDKLMLGALVSEKEVGLYDCACRIVIVPSVIIGAVIATIMPRISNLYANRNHESANKLMDDMALITTLMGCAMAFGLSAVGYDFAILFYGKDFSRTGIFIVILCPAILFRCLSGIIRSLHIIPTGKDRIYVISIVSGAAINLIINAILIPRFSGFGAITGTLVAELLVMCLQMFLCRSDINLRKYMINTVYLSITGTVMFLCVSALRLLPMNLILRLLLEILLGAIIYLSLAWIYIRSNCKDSVIYKEITGFFQSAKT